MNLSLRRSSSFLLAALVTLSATACTFTSGLDEVQKEKDKARTFDTPPDGSPFVLDYDAYIQPASQTGATARVSVMRKNDRLTTVQFTTFLFP